MVEPDIFISINGSAPGSFLHFRNPDNLSDGVDKRVHGLRGIATTSCNLYFHAAG